MLTTRRRRTGRTCGCWSSVAAGSAAVALCWLMTASPGELLDDRGAASAEVGVEAAARGLAGAAPAARAFGPGRLVDDDLRSRRRRRRARCSMLRHHAQLGEVVAVPLPVRALGGGRLDADARLQRLVPGGAERLQLAAGSPRAAGGSRRSSAGSGDFIARPAGACSPRTSPCTSKGSPVARAELVGHVLGGEAEDRRHPGRQRAHHLVEHRLHAAPRRRRRAPRSRARP